MTNKLTKQQKDNTKDKKATTLLRDASRETKKLTELKKDIGLAETKEEKQQLTEYSSVLQEKITFILNSLTQEKMNSANLAQLAKAFRVFAEKASDASKDAEKNERKPNININLNIDNMTTEELLQLLSKKNQKE